MEMETSVVENVSHVKLRGRLDSNGVDQIETQFAAFVVPAGRNAVVDLSDVTFITSMAMRMLIEANKALRRRNAKMVMFAPQQRVSEVFAVAAFSSLVPIVRDEAEAIASIRA